VAQNFRLHFSTQDAAEKEDAIRRHFEGLQIKVRSINVNKDGQSGTIRLQRKEDLEAARRVGRTICLDGGTEVTLHANAPGSSSSTTCPSVGVPKTEIPVTAPNFLNPYHFVDVREFTPRYTHLSHDTFQHHMGRVSVELEFIRPAFIPDSENVYYVINDDTIAHEDEEERGTTIHQTISDFLSRRNIPVNRLPLGVYFDPDCRGWSAENPDEHVVVAGGAAQDNREGWLKGEIHLIQRPQGDRSYAILTRERSRFGHKVMEFFTLNRARVLPPTSLKGMVRNTVENLSNSCFCGYDPQDDDSTQLFHRLDVEKQTERDEASRLRPVVIVSQGENWAYVNVQQARVLSPHLYNRMGASGENALGVYCHSAPDYFEKISHIGRPDQDITKCTGLEAYHRRKSRRGRIENIPTQLDVEASPYQIDEVNDTTITHPMNTHKHTFPFVPKEDSGALYAIIRSKREYRDGRSYQLYKIKAISRDLTELRATLRDFQDSSKNPDAANLNVEYAVSEIRIKTSFDIDRKTQHRAFFLFGKQDFKAGVCVANHDPLDLEVIARFKTLLQRRKANAEKLRRDKEGLNTMYRKEMPDTVYDGMLAFYHSGQKYLTYTTVPQKPYKKSPREILNGMGKLACNELEKLCPACQMFGTAVLKDPEAPADSRRKRGLMGKLSFSYGKPIKPEPAQESHVVLKPLATPKPTYYPFYIVDNRGSRTTRNGFIDYDNRNAHIGRKIYLHHNETLLNYGFERETNLNATIRPVPSGSKFTFVIDFNNLTNYELGLLLYSLDMVYKGKKPAHRLGMGKPLGLGSCTLRITKLESVDVLKRYSSLEDSGIEKIEPQHVQPTAWPEFPSLEDSGIEKIEPGDPRIGVFKNIYRYVQGATTQNEFRRRLNAVSKPLDQARIVLPEPADIEAGYFARKYIEEFHLLSSLNVHPDYMLDIPILFAGGREKAFEWYKAAKGQTGQRLFDPSALKTARELKQDLIPHSLRA